MRTPHPGRHADHLPQPHGMRHPNHPEGREGRREGGRPMKIPKAIQNHPAVETCTSGEAGGSDYRYDIWLRSGWQFTQGRAAGCRGLFANTVADFLYAKPTAAIEQAGR